MPDEYRHKYLYITEAGNHVYRHRGKEYHGIDRDQAKARGTYLTPMGHREVLLGRVERARTEGRGIPCILGPGPDRVGGEVPEGEWTPAGGCSD